MKKKLALVTILTFLFIMMAGFVPALGEDGVGEWVELEKCPINVIYRAAAIEDKIYVVGHTVSNGSAQFAIYDTTLNQWELKSGLNSVKFCSAVVLDGKFYVLGGEGAANSIRFYDPVTDDWTGIAAQNPLNVMNTTATAINGKIYVAGGSTADTNKDFKVFDPATRTWTELAPCIQANLLGISINVNGKMYLGGDGTLFSVYDPETDAWTRLADSPSSLRANGMGVINGKIYASGGSSVNAYKIYDPITNEWTRFLDSPVEMNSTMSAAAAVNEKYYVIANYGFSAYTPEDYTDPTNPTDPTEPATPTNLQILGSFPS